MLITNFASGELSKTLFGRTDLRQYYSGAARMENFDVIPTGGIKRRTGMERILPLEREGRIITLVVSGDEAYLLLLQHEKIILYRAGEWGAPKKIFCNEDISQGTLYADEEIPEVHYAQKLRMMVLTHKNHPPLQIHFFPDNILIGEFPICCPVEFVHSPGLIPVSPAINDETYSTHGFLTTKDSYPGCVSFFNGRIIFASTTAHGQRLFFSKVDNIYNFSTYKKFITEKKNYITVRGKISGGSRRIELVDKNEAEKITLSPTEYTVDSSFFPEGTMLVTSPREITEDGAVKIIITVDKPPETILSSMPDGVEDELDQKVTEFVNKNNNKTLYNAIATISLIDRIGGGYVSFVVDIEIGSSQAVLKANGKEDSFFIPASMALSFDEGRGADLLETLIKNAGESLRNKIGGQNILFSGDAWIKTPLGTVINAWKNTIVSLMKYQHPRLNSGNAYYDYTPNIRSKILNAYAGNSEIYIPLYTKEQIEDEYPTPDCGFTFEIASDMNDAIRWLAVNKGLIVGTESAEYIIPPGVHATNVQAVLNSRYGSDSIQGTAIGDATVFFQAGKKSLVEYYIPQQDNNFRANNMALLSPQMLNESPAREFDFISSPHIKLLVTREDGTMATLLYERSTGTFAWGRITTGPEMLEDPRTPEHKARLEEIREQRPGIKQAPVDWRRVTSGKIRSAAVLPGEDGNDDAYMVVGRGDGWFLERLRESGNIYLDSWRKVTRDGWAALKAEYGEKAALCRLYLDDQDERGLVHYEALEAGAEPDWDKGGDFYIGYPYTSVIRTMPVFHPKMDKNRVIAMIFRFLESYMPRMRAIDNGRPVGDDPVTGIEDKYLPYTGTHRKLNPGGWADDTQSELYTDKPLPVTILTLNAEMAEGR